MKVLVLGGCADMAVPLLPLLKNDADVKKVVLADLNADKAQGIASQMGAKFSAVRCDAMDHDGVVSLMKGNDVVFCYVGPFYVFEKKLAACAIEAGVNYVSIADDYDAYLDVITLEKEAKKKGVKILTGFGNSPGLTQVLARQGYNDVKNATRINVNWCAGSDEAAGPSNLTHLFHIFNGTTRQTFDGREVPVKTGDGKKLVEFPAPVGAHHVYYTGHAESVSLPRNLKGITEATLHGGVKPGYIVKLIKMMSSLGLLKTHARRAALAKFFYRIEGLFASGGMDKSVGRIDVFGSEKGRETYKFFTYVGHIAEITSLPLYVAGKWLHKKKFSKKPGGVYSAERILDDPRAFINDLKKLGVAIYESDLMHR
jgi:saccharopine dehydrogenase-like NADP-dependent oxidoreductase